MPYDDKLILLRIARAYYLEGRTQQAIAKEEGLHRTQISRMLKLARDRGYVRIEVAIPPEKSITSLAEQVRQALSLKEVHLAPHLTPPDQADQALYYTAASYLEQALAKSRRIGIGVGKTLYHVASLLSVQNRVDSPNFYSAAGWSGTDNPYLQGNVVLDAFARAFRGKSHYNNFPICLEKTRLSALEQDRLQALQSAYATLDTVVLSIGGPFTPDYPYMEEFSLMEREIDLSKVLTRPHGNLLGHIFYDQGGVLDLPPNYLISSMELDLLVRLEEVICLAHGRQKIGPIISAARMGSIKTLITDQTTASGILDRLGQET